MAYKYKKSQLFSKKVAGVPDAVYETIYSKTLSLENFFKYNLKNRIPIECMNQEDRQLYAVIPKKVLDDISIDYLTIENMAKYGLVGKISTAHVIEKERALIEKFGVEKLLTLDWDMIKSNGLMDLLSSLDPSTPDLATALNERSFDVEHMQRGGKNDYYRTLARDFNNGTLSIRKIISNWKMFEGKNLSRNLATYDVSESALRDFMAEHEKVASLVCTYGEIEPLIKGETSHEILHKQVEAFSESLLDKTVGKYGSTPDVKLENSQYEALFDYVSPSKFLGKHEDYYGERIGLEIEAQPKGYVEKLPFSAALLTDFSIASFVGRFGLKNVVDFDNECGGFFSNNDAEMLKLMNDMYMRYAGNEHDPEKNIYQTKVITSNADYDRPYTKDEFYESMRRMIVNGPSNGDYHSKAPDYRKISGGFRERNSALYIDESAPEELKNLFYTKSITPEILAENPSYVEFLRGKDLSSCFKQKEIRSGESGFNYENIYQNFERRFGFDDTMDIVIGYRDMINMANSWDYSSITEFFDKQLALAASSKEIKEVYIARTSALLKNSDLPYPEHIPDEMKTAMPELFLDSVNTTGYTSEQLAEFEQIRTAFYSKKITPEFIHEHPLCKKVLKDKDLSVCLERQLITASSEFSKIRFGHDAYIKKENLYQSLVSRFGFEQTMDFVDEFRNVIEIAQKGEAVVHTVNKTSKAISTSENIQEVKKAYAIAFEDAVANNSFEFTDDVPQIIKDTVPAMFLKEGSSDEFKTAYYSRKLTPELCEKHSQEIGETNIAYGFPAEFNFLIKLFDKLPASQANSNRLKVVSAYSKIGDANLKNIFISYLRESGENLNIDKLDIAVEVLQRLTDSNSVEMYTFRTQLADQLLKSANPIAELNKIENVFLKNSLPVAGKIFSVFEVMHPNCEGFRFDNASMVSPKLKRVKSPRLKNVIISSDLIKISLASNNDSMREFIRNIEKGNTMFLHLANGDFNFADLNPESKKIVVDFREQLLTLDRVKKHKDAIGDFEPSEDVVSDIKTLASRLLPDTYKNKNALAHLVVYEFAHVMGINNLEQAKEYMSQKISSADARNRNAAKAENFTIEEGDFVKGIDGKFFADILRNGSVAKEFLGSSAGSDLTPLDTDVSMVTKKGETIDETIKDTAANSYGGVYFVLKNDDRFATTRTKEGNDNPSADNLTKMEAFYTGFCDSDNSHHYGIRTGFASSDIDFIVVNSYSEKIGLDIALNGFYIPVVDRSGKLVFSEQDYDNLRAKMSGLSKYGEEHFEVSENLYGSDVEEIAVKIPDSEKDVKHKRKVINDAIAEALEGSGLKLKTSIDGNLQEGSVELIDTGSTGRGTNKPGDGDFDFMMRLDKSVLSNPKRLDDLKSRLIKKFGDKHTSEIIATGDFRLKSVEVQDVLVDIDISFVQKTNKVSYSTDMALEDRMKTIRAEHPDKYPFIVANILLAKQVLKKAEAYKPNRGETPQGGLGGVGIENWVLQHGGSFHDAVQDFLQASEGKDFEEFKNSYHVWDFGENHFAEKKGLYPHDNFVEGNMSAEGYQKMRAALLEYAKTSGMKFGSKKPVGASAQKSN